MVEMRVNSCYCFVCWYRRTEEEYFPEPAGPPPKTNSSSDDDTDGDDTDDESYIASASMKIETLAQVMCTAIDKARNKFSCMEAVRWLVLNGKAENESDACRIGGLMIQHGLIKHINGGTSATGSTEVLFQNSPAMICMFTEAAIGAADASRVKSASDPG